MRPRACFLPLRPSPAELLRARGAVLVAVVLTACSEPSPRPLGPAASGGGGGDPWTEIASGTGDPGDPSWSSSSGDGSGSPSDGDDVAGYSGGWKFDAGTQPEPPVRPACPCAPGTDRVLVLSSLGVLWTYDPATAAFEELGSFDCPVFSSSSFSLALDHQARALVEYRATGDIFRVDLATLACEDPGYEPPASEPRRFGLAFVATSKAESCEALLGWSFDGSDWSEGDGVGSLVRFDPQTLARSPIASVHYNGGEMAGTGDGRAFVFAGVAPAQLLRVDLEDGEVEAAMALPGVELTSAFAMAFWGGDVHVFTESEADSDRSRVLRVELPEQDDDSPIVTVDVASAPILVVGAATSTCAPLTPAG